MKLLLHACCGPCSLEPVRLLKEEGHDITIAYMNSNIAPASEYQHRLSTLLDWAKAQDIPVIEGPYEPTRWQEAIRNAWHPHSSNSDSTQTSAHTKQTSAHTNHEASAPRVSFPLEASSAFVTSSELDASPASEANSQTITPSFNTGIDPEFDPARNPKFAYLYHDRENRCRACYRIRLEELARFAHEHGFEGIGTTLTVSPYQYTAIIQEELQRAAKPYQGLSVVFRDYRPYYPEATKRSRDLGMYRQNYCGCAYSDKEAAAEREARKAARKKKKAEERRAKLQALTTDDFDYELPEELIAQEPAPIRDECRLLVMKRDTGTLEDKIFRDIIDYLQPGDLLVANETRVMPARLIGHKRETGGTAEVFLLREAKQDANRSNQSATWEALVRPGKRLKPGAIVDFVANSEEDNESSNENSNEEVVLSAEVIDWVEGAQKGERLVRLTTCLPSLDEALHAVGHTPLPPYIKNYAGDEELYQTVYSHEERSAAAPTAGLHFTPELIECIKEKGIGWETVHLEVGLDTFRIVEEDNPRDHQIHTERYTVPQQTVDAIKRTKEQGGRVIAVGTTSVRSLESAWDAERGLIARDREATSLYILPGYEFKVVDALITNFHVPRSTLMMLVSAFSTRDNIMKAYHHAIKRKYRMLSFGDAMFIR